MVAPVSTTTHGRTATTALALAGFLAATLTAALATSPASGQQFPVQSAELTNGLKVLMAPDRSIPNVALYFFYRVGSRNERPGLTGLSHYFEHMMFNGARKYGPGMFDRVMEDNGGANNAYTDMDLTAYMDWFPSPALPLILDLEADRIAALNFDPKMVESERGVVANERRLSVENDVRSLLGEQLAAAAFTAHPYQWPVIGWMSDIQSWTREDLIHYFRTYYAPNNCVLVAVGAFEPAELLRLARERLEPIPPQAPPPAVTTVEPEQLGERRVLVRQYAELPILQVGYHSPAAADPDYVPLAILEHILLSGRSSRLYQRLVDKEQLAIEVGGGQSPHVNPYLFTIDIQPRDGADLARVEQVLYEELEKARSSPVNNDELQKAKNTALTDFYRSVETINGKANALGTYELLFGSYERLFAAPGEMQKITAEDVQRVARKYFDGRRRTVAVLVPENETNGKAKDE